MRSLVARACSSTGNPVRPQRQEGERRQQLSHEEPLFLARRVNRPLDQVGLARIFEPEVKERAGVPAALRKRFQPLKAQLRSQVPRIRCNALGAPVTVRNENYEPDESLSTSAATTSRALAHENQGTAVRSLERP